jgi:hypothetical protein
MEGGFLTFFEELKNIENRVAWFLEELCKAKKGVQKYNDGNRDKMQISFVEDIVSKMMTSGKIKHDFCR